MQTHQAPIDELNRYTVTIQEIKEDCGIGRILGTGVVVTEDGLIVTCYHVMGSLRNKIIDFKTVGIYFPSIPDIKGHANVLQEHSDASSDTAFLQLQEKLPNEAAVANLSESVHTGNNFRSFGFRKPTQFKGLLAEGKIRGKIISKAKDGADSVAIQLSSDEIGPGMSGAPVLDLATNRVTGIISEHWISTGNVDTSLNFAIPIDYILKVHPDLKQKNPGLKPIFDFVEKLGVEGTRKYERIDELYVPPTNYDEINNALQDNRILFLAGTQEYGKTYTAVHLLWEYYNKEYEPVWFKGSEEKEERRDVRKRFANVEKYLKPHNIVYFEDPFGKTEYEVTVDEGIMRNIATIIETVENTEDTYVIITSREEVFKEFEQKIIAEVDLRKYEKKLCKVSFI